MNLLHNYAKYAEKREKKRKKEEIEKEYKMSQNGNKSVYFRIKGFFFHIFLTRIRKKLYKFAAYLKMEVKTNRNFSPKTLLTNYL